MKKFHDIMAELASGGEPDLSEIVRRRPNGPPPISLTPSESAVSDLVEGATNALSPADQAIAPVSVMSEVPGVQRARDFVTARENEPPPMDLGQGSGRMAPEQYGLAQTEDQMVMPSAPGMPETSQISGTVRNPTPDEELDLEERNLIDAGQIVKKSPWKNAWFGALQGLRNGLNNTNEPVVSWDEMKRDKRVAPIAAKVGMLRDQKKRRQQQQEFETGEAHKRALTADIEGRPAQKEADRKAREALAVKRITLNADIRSGIAKPVTNEEGYIELEYLNADSKGVRKPNELLKGADGQPIRIPGEQGIEWLNPRTNKTEIIKAKQGAVADAQIAEQDARSQQDADKFNATNQLRAMTENVNHQIQYNSQVSSLLSSAIAADTSLVGNATVTGLREQYDTKQRELVALQNEQPAAYDDKAIKTRADRINSLNDDLTGLAGKLWTEVGKTEQGKAKAAEIQGMIGKLQKPGKVTYTPITASKVSTGKPVPAGKDPMGLFK